MAKYLGVPLEISNGNKIPRNGQPNIVTNPKFLGEETVSGNYKSIDNWRLQADPIFGFLTRFSPLNESTASSEYPKNTNIVANIGNLGTTYVDLQAMDDTGSTPLDVFEIGKSYELTYSIWFSSGINKLMMSVSGEDVVIDTAIGTHRYSFIAQETQLKFFRNYNSADVLVTLSDISVKEIAATETPTYGSPELVENGDFKDGTTGWTASSAGSTFTVGAHQGRSGVADIGITDTADTSRVFQSFDFVAGITYLFSVDVYVVSGSFRADTVQAVYAPDFVSTTTTGVWQTLTARFVSGSTQAADIVLRSTNQVSEFYVDSVSIKEASYLETSDLINKPYKQFFNLQENWTANNSSLYFEGNGSSSRYASPKINLEFGKTYRVKFDVLNKTLSGTFAAGLSNTGYFSQVPASQRITQSTGNTSFEFVAVLEDVAGKDDEIKFVGLSSDTFTIANLSVTEIEHNYLQVTDANFKGLVKEGDVVFNTSTSTEGVVKEVKNDNVLLMSNNNFSTAGEFFSVFAPNNDTRGNQILKIDDLAAFDYNLPAGVKSSFWFSGAKNANNLSLYSIGESYEYHFTSKLIEEYIQRLDSQSATSSRLDIPLNKFRDGSSVTVINDIRIS